MIDQKGVSVARGSTMIDELRNKRLLSLVKNETGLIGYRFSGPLFEAFEALDSSLVSLFERHFTLVPHSCTTLIQREVLEAIGFFDKLPCIPMTAVPHEAGAVEMSKQDEWVLSPSTCYHTFAHLAGIDERWDLRTYTARGICHRFEPSSEATRLANFTMREFVLIGDEESVVSRGESAFNEAVDFIGKLHSDVSVSTASDVFYGEQAEVTRRVQLARGVKREVLVPWEEGDRIAIGSRNLHRDLFTEAFRIGSAADGPAMHSMCIAFGMERMLLGLLAQTPDHDPLRLTAALEAN
ncbi:hypothetical protein [Streptomyces tsukubensis]|uniref:Aminoacyl-transfer RNA synthetases class-II family profile domain-containing protein n=1 Tax=Streptomyces tsukubensis TaxID=83656 RepID=A0A1V4AD95_9ACTN|nr:hypothetical protein [Streptomyces tsukubensis]OON81420.1 hypothetical protein B1H18_08880 [Streptomyces tsukubensis]QFR95450.1 hypothetical protein GBW32_23550 [Streptomyces tsukubensis]